MISSLNDVLLTGLALHTDVTSVLIRWRLYRYVYGADIAKIYRQILIHPDDRKYQRILWRHFSNDCISIFNLNTDTYGVGPSVYQPLRCLSN